MAEVTIYGASDDLVELEGDLEEEFSYYDGKEPLLLAVSDGTLLEVRYGSEGVWRITQRAAGSAAFSKVEAPPNDESNYSDRVTLVGDIQWIVGAKEYELVAERSRV